jgi:hypothetical protein
MTVEELIHELKCVNPNSEVLFASQPSWPFEYTLGGVIEIHPESEYDNEDPEASSVVYIAEGRQKGYLNGEAKDELGW